MQIGDHNMICSLSHLIDARTVHIKDSRAHDIASPRVLRRVTGARSDGV